MRGRKKYGYDNPHYLRSIKKEGKKSINVAVSYEPQNLSEINKGLFLVYIRVSSYCSRSSGRFCYMWPFRVPDSFHLVLCSSLCTQSSLHLASGWEESKISHGDVL